MIHLLPNFRSKFSIYEINDTLQYIFPYFFLNIFLYYNYKYYICKINKTKYIEKNAIYNKNLVNNLKYIFINT